jgi:AcrR family transcriptional regulator
MAGRILRSGKKNSALIRDSGLLQMKQEEIAKVALDLFLRDGFHGTTTREIARRAGGSAGSIFTYFKNKEHILFHIITREQERAETQLVDALRRQIEDATLGGADAEAVFVAVFATFMHAIDDLRRFILLAYQETKSLDQEARHALTERERRLQRVLSQAIDYGVAQRRFSPGDIELKAHSIVVLAHAWAVRRWAFAGVMESIEDYIRFLEPQVLAMLKSDGALAVLPSRDRDRKKDGKPAVEHRYNGGLRVNGKRGHAEAEGELR